MFFLTSAADFLDQMVPFLLGGASALLAFLLRRWWTKEGEREKVSKFAELTQIASLLRAGELTVEDVAEVERMLLTKGELPATKKIVSLDFQTQAEMNDYASREVQKLDLELNKVMIDVEAVCDEREAQLLKEAQAKWLEFRAVHAEFVSEMFEGGSMRPLMYFTSIETATRDRLEELEGYLEARAR